MIDSIVWGSKLESTLDMLVDSDFKVQASEQRGSLDCDG